ncbi:MAG TPA: NADH-quinone oxidoreductase subunit NuoE [Dehalococcoidales bacterium]|nr:NADH-quinone oxidoreductase subunit NuoE [Dehalococcoidales bacterium]
MSQQGISTRHQGREDLVVLLKEAQSKFGYIPEEVIAGLAETLHIPVNDVYGVASFYSFLDTKPLGRNVIRVCKSLPCYLKHSQLIIESVAREIGIKPGETTADGRFSFQLTNCIGACDGAPAMMINDEVHVDLTPEKIARLLKSYK